HAGARRVLARAGPAAALHRLRDELRGLAAIEHLGPAVRNELQRTGEVRLDEAVSGRWSGAVHEELRPRRREQRQPPRLACDQMAARWIEEVALLRKLDGRGDEILPR